LRGDLVTDTDRLAALLTEWADQWERFGDSPMSSTRPGLLDDTRVALAGVTLAPQPAPDTVWRPDELAAFAPQPDTASRELREALLNWYDTTHGNEFGHDHHCPAPWSDEPYTQPIFDGCTCGWSDVQRADQTRAALAATEPER
jgi:hypothetical protein